MYRLSDSDSVDSDKGIRYKTDSIRNKSNSSETDSQSSRRDSRHHSDKYKKRSRSRSPYHRDHSKKKKTKKRKRNHSSEDEDDQRNYSRISSKKNIRRSSEYSISDKDIKGSGSKQEEKRSGGQYVEQPLKKLASNATFGPTLPPKVSETLVKAELPLAVDQNQLIGPSLPPHLKKQESDSVMGPALPPHLIKNFSSVSQSSSIEPTQIVLEEKLLEKNLDNNTFGPSLPPKLNQTSTSLSPTSKPENTPIGSTFPLDLTDIDPDESSDSLPLVIDDSENRVIGPSLPPHLKQILLEESSTSQADTLEAEELEEVYGPLPVGETYSKAHMELEERALKLKIDQLEPPEDKQPIREEWMLTLPEGKSAKFGLGPRQFKARAGPDLSDRSSWTDTPEDKARKKATGVEVEPKVDLKREAELKEIHRRDEEQEAVAKKSKKHKDSLLEMHQKKIKQEKKNEAGPSERRPFSREIDLQVDRFDEAQKKAVLKKAQLLDSRFSTGESKYL